MLPKILNLGSGKTFMQDAFNIDISPQWSPDAVVDISKHDLQLGKKHYKTARFGEVTLDAQYFEKIICHDVLEHVSNLVQTMTNALHLLQEGGSMDIIVPYDLSYGAWQDPTHVRAFNENSWLYYTDWFWYLNWTEHRFYTKSLDLNLSVKGQRLYNKLLAENNSICNNNQIQVIYDTPRAVDSMSVVLVKKALDNRDKETYALHHQGRQI